MPKKTQHYQLNQYEPQDSFLRTDFNEDNARIDAALWGVARGVPQLRFGAYQGQYGEGTNTATAIELGGQPQVVFLFRANGSVGDTSGRTYGGIFTPEYPLQKSCYQHEPGEWAARSTATGFEVRNNGTMTNVSNFYYYYLAIL